MDRIVPVLVRFSNPFPAGVSSASLRLEGCEQSCHRPLYTDACPYPLGMLTLKSKIGSKLEAVSQSQTAPHGALLYIHISGYYTYTVYFLRDENFTKSVHDESTFRICG